MYDEVLFTAMEWGRKTDWVYGFAKYCDYYDEDVAMIEKTIEAGLMFVFQSPESLDKHKKRTK